MGTSTFSQYTVLADVSVVAINPKAPLEKSCLLGCGITTGEQWRPRLLTPRWQREGNSTEHYSFFIRCRCLNWVRGQQATARSQRLLESVSYLVDPLSSDRSELMRGLWVSSENSNVAVFGIGCVGLSILQGARAKKCAKVIAVDTNPGKEEWAKKFGASE